LLDALVVAVARPATALAGRPAFQAGAATLVAGPLRLGDVPPALAVAAVDERRVDLHVEFVGCQVQHDEHVRPLEVDLGAGLPAEAFAHLAVEFGLELLARVRGQADVLAQQSVVFLQQGRDLCAGLVGGEVVLREGVGGTLGPLVVAPALVLADPAVPVGFELGDGIVRLQGERDPERPAPLRVGQPETPVGHQPAEAGITERAGLDRPARRLQHCH